MDLINGLQTFIRVVETGSFSAVAREVERQPVGGDPPGRATGGPFRGPAVPPHDPQAQPDRRRPGSGQPGASPAGGSRGPGGHVRQGRRLSDRAGPDRDSDRRGDPAGGGFHHAAGHPSRPGGGTGGQRACRRPGGGAAGPGGAVRPVGRYLAGVPHAHDHRINRRGGAGLSGALRRAGASVRSAETHLHHP